MMSSNDGIRILSHRVLKGPNIWAYRPVIELLVNIGRYEELPSNLLPGFTERLASTIPSLYDHRCSEGHAGGFFERLRMGTWMGHILEHLILELQSLAGMESGYGKTRSADNEGEYKVVFDYKDVTAAFQCVDLAIELLEAAARQQEYKFDLQQRLGEIRATAEENMLGPSTRAIVDAARRRKIPWMQLHEGGSLMQLGHGAMARRIQAAETSLTSNIGVDIASDKHLTKELLDRVGVPVPKGETVHNVDDAWAVAQRLGGPVVVKPADGNQGRAVSVNLTTEEQVRKAVELAQEESRTVIAEQYITGSDYRLLVVGGQLVAAAQRKPAQVTGDGRSTIRQLVDQINNDPRRGSGHGCALTRIRMDAAAELTLSKQEMNWDSIPPAGHVVLLRDCSNLSTGGTAVDVTDLVHPDNAAQAVLAAKVVGLDIAGIDVICDSIRRPLGEQKGAIVEVNAAPGLRMHVQPSQGRSRPVGDAIIEQLFPGYSNGRIPLIAVTGTNGKTTVTRMIAHVFSTMKRYVGMATTDGIYYDGVCRTKGDCAGPRSAEAVLQHPMVEVAVLETARGGILRSGLGWDRSQVSVVLNIADDHLGIGGINTREDLARVKRVIVESVLPDGYGVLNADDPLVAAMADKCPGHVIYFGADDDSPVISQHLAAGGRAAYLRESELVLAEGSEETFLLRAEDIPATFNGLIPFQVQNALAAAAACWGAGVPWHYIRLGLRTFQADAKSTPGRFNVFQLGDAKVIVDYAHNPHAMQAMRQAVLQMRPRRSWAVLASPGDRRDSDIRDLGRVAAQTFDEIIVREDVDLRDRKPGETAALLAEGIHEAEPTLPVTTILDESEAVRHGLAHVSAGDVLVIFADHVDDTIALVEEAMNASRRNHRTPPYFRTPAMDRRRAEAAGPRPGPFITERRRNPYVYSSQASVNNGNRSLHNGRGTSTAPLHDKERNS